jgi:hypothetical protein
MFYERVMLLVNITLIGFVNFNLNFNASNKEISSTRRSIYHKKYFPNEVRRKKKLLGAGLLQAV